MVGFGRRVRHHRSISSRVHDIALIQYTSGSTGDPKGVLLSHANVLANIRAFGEAIRIRPDDVGVSWLPLYHDMGLIGSWLGALYFGIPSVICRRSPFCAPARWLWALHDHRGNALAGAELRLRPVRSRDQRREIHGVDLEPVAPGLQRLGAGESGDDRSLRRTFRRLRVPRRGHVPSRTGWPRRRSR